MSEEEIPEADPRSDLDYEERLEIDGGTLVWKDPVASGKPIRTAYLWPILIIGLVVFMIVWIVA